VIALTGASGYVGSHLLQVLEADGRPVRALSRSPERIEGRAAKTTEIVAADLLDASSLVQAFDGADALVYLAHGLGGDDFARSDRQAASNAAEAAEAAGVGRIVYLGGLGRGDDLSPHLRSRQEVGRILRESAVPTAELRASIVLGEGSASYDLLRAVVDHVPAAAVPDWARSQAQPIHVDDVVAYLRAALDVDLPASRIYEIGGPDRLSYLDLMNLYATEHDLTRFFVPVPVLPGVDLWQRALERVAPEQLTVWLRLVESLRNETTAQDDAAGRDFPDVRPRPVVEALRAAA
jgi:uncharacterized protein YbjT (DUF2867 family)